MKVKRLASFGASLVLSLSSLFVFVPVVHAATITWDGGGTTNNFSEGANWSNNVVPGTSDDVVFDTTVDPEGTLVNDLVGSIFQSIAFTGNGSHSYSIDGSQELTVSGGISNTSNRDAIINIPIEFSDPQTIATTNEDITFNGEISGSGNLTKTGTYDLTLGENNSSFTGTITASGGTLRITDLNALGNTGAGTTIGNSATLRASVEGTLNEPLTLNGTGHNSGSKIITGTCAGPCTSSTLTLAGALNLGANQTVYVYDKVAVVVAGSINGGFQFTIAPGSAGTLNKGSGAVKAERLIQTLSDSLASTILDILPNNTVVVTGSRGATSVFDTGILKGKGTVGAITVFSGGTLAPGESPGCLNSGNLTFNSGSTYEFEVGGATECTEYDQTKVTGTVNLGNGTLSVVRFNDFKPAAGQKYTIISNDSNDAVTGTFNNLAEGAEVTVDGYVMGVSYVGGDGNDVVLTVKTVPSSPNTGFALLSQNPMITFAITTVLAGSLYILSRHTRAQVR